MVTRIPMNSNKANTAKTHNTSNIVNFEPSEHAEGFQSHLDSMANWTRERMRAAVACTSSCWKLHVAL
eukprot:2832737-Amphidinium_carterae.1